MDALYVTTLEWKKHIREKHSRAQWICDPCWLDSESPEEFEFDSEEEWHKHALTEHEDEVEEGDLSDLAELSQRTGVPAIACPLCYEDASLRNPETDNHLAEHLHSFALQALPWEVTGCDDETQVSMGSDIRKSDYSGDSEKSSPEKDQEDNDEIAACHALLTTIINSPLYSFGLPRGSVSDLLVEMRFYLQGLSARLNDSNPLLRSEISSCLTRLVSILQRSEVKSFTLLELSSLDPFEQDLAEGFRSLQHLARLSLVDSLETSSLHESEALGYSGISEPLDGHGSEKARDPENWDIDTSDRVGVHASTVKKARPRQNKGPAEPEVEEVDDEGNPIDPDEPRYCSCNQVSFGLMIQCDNVDVSSSSTTPSHPSTSASRRKGTNKQLTQKQNCKEEWFHLECVGLAEVPPRTTKWYCPECRVLLNIGEKGEVSARGVKRILPYERNSEFIARPGLSDKIVGMVPTSSQGSRSGALWGAGGSGKTQLGLEYAYTRCDDPNCSVFWVRADNAATFTEDYRLIAKELEIEQHLKGDDLLAAVCSSIEAHQPWVFILDGADDVSLFNRTQDSDYLNSLFDFVPKGPRGTVLWTTRDENLGRLVSKPRFCFKIPSMGYSEAGRLLASTRGQMARHREISDVRDETAQLLKELQCLPLAIVQAGSYMRHTDTSIHDYMTLLVESKQRPRFVVSKWSVGVVLFTSAISLAWIRQQNRAAYEMVHVLAHLDNRNITLTLLSELIRDTEDATNREDSQRLSRATEELATLHLISPAGSGCQSFKMHPIVQDAVRDCQDDTGPASWSIFLAKALSLAIRFFSVNHAVSVCKRAETGARENEATALLRQVSKLLDNEERWLEKEPVDKRVLELQERVLGESHPETISSSMSLAATFFQQGRSDKAMDLATRALEMRHKTWGEKNLYTMKSKVAIGMIYHQQGLYREAEATYGEVLNLQIRGSGLEMETRPYVIDCLAWTYYVQGRYEEAEAQLESSWSLHRELHGDEHPDTLQALHQLAVVVHMSFDPHRGIELMQTCVETRRAVLGFAHPLTNVSTLLLEEWKEEQKSSKAVR